MSSYGHSLVPKRGVQVQKIANIDFFAPKLYLRGVDIEMLKAAWRLEEHIFHSIEKRENH